MSGKFMKKRKVILPMMTVLIIASQLLGCSAVKKDEASNILNGKSEIVLEVATLAYEEQGKEIEQLDWIVLGENASYPEFRKAFNELFSTETIYINQQGEKDLNVVLKDCLSNKSFADKFTAENITALSDSVSKYYSDLSEADNQASVINAYYNLLDDKTPSYFNGSSSLSRAEALTLVARATMPVQTLPTDNVKFKDSKYGAYAELIQDKAYLGTKDMAEKQFNSPMSKGEYIYLILNAVYGENSGNSDGRLEELAKAIESDGKAPSEIEEALAKAKDLGLNTEDWDLGITKTRAIDMLVDVFIAKGQSAEAQSENQLKERAKASYEKVQASGEVGVEQSLYYEKFIEIAKQGGTDDGEIEKALVQYFKDLATPPVAEQPTEPPTQPATQPAEPATEQATEQSVPTAPEGSYKDEEVKVLGDGSKKIKRTYENGYEEHYIYDITVGSLLKADERYALTEESREYRSQYIKNKEAAEQAHQAEQAQQSALKKAQQEASTNTSSSTYESEGLNMKPRAPIGKLNTEGLKDTFDTE